MMRALTLTQPWAGLVAAEVKLIENRWRRMIKREDFGKPFALHASRQIDESVYGRIYDLAPELRPATALEASGIEAPPPDWYRLSRITSAVIGVATIDKELGGGWTQLSIAEHADQISDSLGIPLGPKQIRWFFGPIGYVLRDVVALPEPVPCRGYQGFWTLPQDVERDVRVQLARAA